MNNFEVYESPMGEISIACFDENGTCIFYANLDYLTSDEVLDMMTDLESGINPLHWNGSANPEEEYEKLTSYESGVELIADNCGYYYDRMGTSAKEIFLYTKRTSVC